MRVRGWGLGTRLGEYRQSKSALKSKMTSSVMNASGVQALSNALAVALFQTTSGTGSPSAVATSGVASASLPLAGHVNVAEQTQPSTPSSAGPSSSQQYVHM